MVIPTFIGTCTSWPSASTVMVRLIDDSSSRQVQVHWAFGVQGLTTVLLRHWGLISSGVIKKFSHNHSYYIKCACAIQFSKNMSRWLLIVRTINGRSKPNQHIVSQESGSRPLTTHRDGSRTTAGHRTSASSDRIKLCRSQPQKFHTSNNTEYTKS